MMPPVPVDAAPAMSPRAAGVLLAAAILCLGVNWPILKLGLRDVDPLWFAAVRIVLTGFCYAAVLLARGRLAWPLRQDLPVLFGVGIFQMGLLVGLMTVGLRYVDAGRSSILIYTTSLWVMPGAVLFLGERASRWQMAGLAVGVVGIAILFNPLDFAWGSRSELLGNGCLLLAALAWAVALLQVRGHRWRMDPLQLLPWQTLVGAAMLVPLAAWRSGMPHLPMTAGFVLAMAYNVVPATCFALWGLVTAGRALPAITMSMAQLATPVVAVASAAAILGERPSPAKLAGLACILAGVALATVAGRISTGGLRHWLTSARPGR